MLEIKFLFGIYNIKPNNKTTFRLKQFLCCPLAN